ncbi:glycoside hydrolase family 36 protein [Paenibacillus oryzisoli]|uniref:glycoside hydrolase family 36 protein n=1 Tax=Paenibacillus oryzisoli TaxID=1850517 RepID=UPI003D2C0223
MNTLIVATEKHEFKLMTENDHVKLELSAEQLGAGVDLIRIRFKAEEAVVPPLLTLSFTHPSCDIHASWHPSMDRNKSFHPDWMKALRSNAATSAPVYSLYNVSSFNRFTFAFSDALNTVHYTGAICEETAQFHCTIQLFKEMTAPLAAYEAELLVDTRNIPYYDSLQDVSNWWNAMPAYKAAFVPEVARSPMYSTWYNMHQEVTAERIEKECRLAQSLGMKAVIVDDGWQTGDNRRGYAYAGDWEVFDGKFPDMRKHVEEVHKLGMKLILWYSVPFVGKHSKAWDRFKNHFLRYNEGQGTGVLDPRYPEVREYIIGKYEQAVKEWQLDGFKLDFIDAFYSPELHTPSTAPGRDYESIPEAVDRLLTDSIGRLRAVKPDIMVEFRQTYIGPAMRKYGNMLRAWDCPNDSIQNRVRTLDIRLICGDTAAHADMIMWHDKDPLESAALQLINALFSVPQISVLLEKLPEDHLRMLQYWLTYWCDNREILLGGKLEPMNPELLYPIVRASKGQKQIVAVYYDTVVSLNQGVQDIHEWSIVNGRMREGIYIEVPEPLGQASVVLQDCCGEVVAEYSMNLDVGVYKLPAPPAGSACLLLMK